MIPSLVFKLTTIPDIAGLRSLLQVPAYATDVDVASIAFHRQRQLNGSEFLPLHQHQICAISCALRAENQLKVWTLGASNTHQHSNEATILQSFFESISQYSPQMISWNGNDFDLPVLQYRTLFNQLQAPPQLHLGEGGKAFERHFDLVSAFALPSSQTNAPLNEIAQLCGFPSQLAMASTQVWGAYQSGDMAAIHHDGEINVAITHLIYLRFQRMRGHLSAVAYEAEVNLVRETLGAEDAPPWTDFLAAWSN